jgi:hypothetical protein
MRDAVFATHNRARLERQGRASGEFVDLADRLARLPALDHDGLRLEFVNSLAATKASKGRGRIAHAQKEDEH